MSSEENRKKRESMKAVYQKPSLNIIELAAEEIMGGCKTLGGLGMISNPCENCNLWAIS